MRLLVTGGAGYIGSHMCKMLAERGHEIGVVDNLSTGHREAVQWGQLYFGDLRDSVLLAGAFASFRPDGVLHFAAKSQVGESIVDPAEYYEHNVIGTLGLLNEVRRRSCPLVFSSSAAIFGDSGDALVHEDRTPNPINAYARTKLSIEYALQDYWRAYHVPSFSLRYFNAAGADPGGSLGEAHHPESHLIPRILESAEGRGETVRIFGADYATPDGTCIRDYIHVNDICSAHLLALEYLKETPGAHFSNLGNGVGFSVREVISAAERIVGHPIQSTIAERRPGDPARLVADSSKVRAQLGWRPDFPFLEDIIASAWRWHRARTF